MHQNVGNCISFSKMLLFWLTSWMTVCVGVALLPFVDERRLRAALTEVYPNLSADESKYEEAG